MASQITLTIADGFLAGKEFVFKHRAICKVGRGEDCDLRIPDAPGFMNVSRHHCVLDVAPPHVWVRDSGSRNGTFVNDLLVGRRSEGQAPDVLGPQRWPERELMTGDELRVGSIVFQVRLAVSAEETRTARPGLGHAAAAWFGR